jgi:UDP-glucose 4-epimerase
MLIIGAGQVGTFVAEQLLAEGHRVAFMDTRPLSEELVRDHFSIDSVDYVRGDIRSILDICQGIKETKPQRILNTAALLPGADGYSTFSVNVMGAVNVLEAARLMDVERVVHTSSSVGYYPSFATDEYEGPTITEEARTASIPGFFYGTSKLAADAIALDYAAFYQMDVMACRLGHVWGPWGGPLGAPISMFLTSVVEDALQGKEVVVDNPMFTWNGKEGFCNIRNVVKGLVGALTVDRTEHRSFNVFDAEPCSFSEFAAALEAAIPGLSIKEGVAASGGYAGMPSPPPFPFDISRSERELGYRPEVGLTEGIEEFVGWMKSRLSVAK